MTADLAGAVGPLVRMLYTGLHEAVTRDFVVLAATRAARLPDRHVHRLSERSAFLIIYGDSIRRPGEAPLDTRARSCVSAWARPSPDVHVLPMFPWTSDDGFAVVDHREVNQRGDDAARAIRKSSTLMLKNPRTADPRPRHTRSPCVRG